MQEPLFDALEGLSTAVLVFDQSARLVWSNSAGLDLLQTPLEPLRGSEAESLLRERLGLDARILEQPPTETRAVDATLADGRSVSLRVRSRGLTDPSYRLLYLESVGGIEETSAPKPASTEHWQQEMIRAEEAVRESELRYRRLFDQSRDIVSISDHEGKLIDVNRAGLELLGYERKEQVLAMDIGRGVWGDPEARRNVFRQAKTRGYAEFETLFSTQDKGDRWVSGTMVEMRDDLDRPEGFLTIVRDVTDQRQVEDQLRQSQKMEAIGRLAGGIAHDFNNLLTAITGYCDLLLDEAPNEEMRSYVREIEAAGTRASALTAKLLTLSRREKVTPKTIDLNASVRDLQGLLRRLIGEDVELRVELEAEPSFVRVDPGQLDQTILNLAANARDAMPKGGKLTLRTETRWITGHDQEMTPPPRTAQLEPGPFACLTVSDTGIGMDARTLKHIYEPFFTTKEAGKGTGLGLATAYATIHRFGGSIEVSSSVGKGSTFNLLLPRVQRETDQEKGLTVRDAAELAQGSETILLVEDDETVRHLVRTQLQRQGYRVVTAEDGESALQKVEETEQGFEIDLVVSDVVMPGMSGPALAAELRRNQPDVPILFISGYTGSFMVQHGFCEDTDEVLQKPFTAKMLAERVRDLLDR